MTEIVTSARATIPEARLASHQACSSTGGLIGRRLPANADARHRDLVPGSGADPAHQLDLAVIVHDQPARSASTRRAPSGPESRAAFASVSASTAVGPSAVAPISPVQAGSPVAGSIR